MQVVYSDWNKKSCEYEMVQQDLGSFVRQSIASDNILIDLRNLQSAFIKLVECLSENGKLTNTDIETITSFGKDIDWAKDDCSFKEVF